jgi:N-acylneuraminate cytidylyltransferase
MIAYTIQAAIQSGCFSRVLVSTDDPLIAEISSKYGADVPFLRNKYADDHSPVSLATISALIAAEQHFGESYDTVVQLMPNCPLRESGDIEKAFSFFESNSHSFQISCFEYGWMNPWWAHTLKEGNVAKPVFSAEQLKTRSQDLDKLYCPTGAIWIARKQGLIDAETFYGENYRFYPMNWKKAIDIDDYDDLEMALYFLNQRRNSL